MKCPQCNVDLQASKDRGVDVEVCPTCQGMWLTPGELDELENKAYDLGNKGTLYVVSHETKLKCPTCSQALRQLYYRFYDLRMDCCPSHGFWLEKGEDDRVLELMREEEKRLKQTFRAEENWTKHIKTLTSPSVF